MNTATPATRRLLIRRSSSCLLTVWLLLLNIFPLGAQTAFSSPLKNWAAAQVKERRITVQAKNEKLALILEKIEKQSGYVFVYANDEVNTVQKVTVIIKEKSLGEALTDLLTPLNINYEMVNDKIILKPVKPSAPLAGGSSGEELKKETPATAGLIADITIEGRVVDAAGKGLEGISVQLAGTNTGTTTDREGHFILRIPEDRANSGTLSFSSVGYLRQDASLAGKRSFLIRLESENKEMNEVVVVGYATQRKISMTGAVDAISKKAIEDRPVTNVLLALQGTSPNLIVQQTNFEPGQPVNLNIRGLGTTGDNTPLIVIDGIPGGDIQVLNPNDIESVSILKDAGSAAIYGSRSANGVILVTTKKGRRNQRPVVSYTGIYGIQSPRITYEPVHAWENAYYKNESLINSGLQPIFTPADIAQFKARGDGTWRLSNILHDAPQQTHNLSIAGGGEFNTYMLSVGYLNQASNYIGPDYGLQRYNLRFNQTTEWGKFKLNTILGYAKTRIKDHSSISSNLIVDAGRVPLYYNFQDSAGNYLTNAVSAELNPKGILEKGGYRQIDNNEIFGNFNGELTIARDFKLRGVFGGTVTNNGTFGRTMEVDFVPSSSYGKDRSVSNYNYKGLFTNVQLLAEYMHTFAGVHDVHILLGAANESYRGEESQIVWKQTDDLGRPTDPQYIDATGTYTSNATKPDGHPATTETSLNSAFGRASYGFGNKYFAEFNFRFDGSSKFASGHRWGFFPSGAVAWRLTEEPFMQQVKNVVGDVKIRASYGVLGNQNIEAYRYQTNFSNYQAAYGFNNSTVTGASYVLGNPDVSWEKASTFNIGGDLTLLNRKLDVSLDYFDKTTRDILGKRQDIPSAFGVINLPDYNVAEVRNRGWEIRATYTLSGRLLTQTFTVNLSDNLNELRKLSSGESQQIQQMEEYQIVRKVGQPITVYQGYKTNGFFQNLDDINKYPRLAGTTVTPGDLKFVDRNHDGVIDQNDKFILGNPFPRYTYGFTYTASIKGFDIMVFIQGVGKRDEMIRGEQVEPFHVGYSGTMYTHQTDFWTPTHPNAKFPKLAENGSPSNTNNYRTGSNLFLFNAAYARLKNLQIGYTLPQALTRKAKIQKARVYFTGQNLVTLSKLNFLDPEITEFNNNTGFGTGANSGRAYPMPIFTGFGIDITFL
ncbi:MAG: TonB-dependent receptor [Chitinophagaceae bacterium]|nr:TonB-dependent receptor [Chitinophagaceae bacterium]